MGSAWQEIKTIHRATTTGAKEGLAFRLFSRPLASFVLYHIQNTRITPNQVTIGSLLVAIAGFIVHMTVLSYAGLLIGCALFMIAHMLDALDGQLARHRKAGSVIGMHFDFFIDEVKAYFVYAAIAIRLFRQSLGEGAEGPLLTYLRDYLSSHEILIVALGGMTALAIGISCTKFLKMAEWKEAFPPAPTTDGTPPPPRGGIIGLIEKVGHFVVDYPSYIVPICLFNCVEIYYVIYTLVIAAYATRALLGIALKLWRVDPYSTN